LLKTDNTVSDDEYYDESAPFKQTHLLNYHILMKHEQTMRDVTPWISETPKLILGDVTGRDGIQAVPWQHIPTKEQRAQWAIKMMKTGIHHIEIGFPVID